MSNYWHKRSVGIKFSGFDDNPYDFSKSINAITDCVVKGDPHGTKNYFKENQLHILKLINEDEFWGEALIDLIKSIGGINEVMSLIESINSKNYFVVINVPESGIFCGSGNNLSIEAIELVTKLGCDVSINYY